MFLNNFPSAPLQIEREEEKVAEQDPGKQCFHLCIVNLVIGTLYCAKVSQQSVLFITLILRRSESEFVIKVRKPSIRGLNL